MATTKPGDSPQRVLLVRPTALGDVVRTVPALVTLRAALPDAQIDWLINEELVDAIHHHPALSNVVPFPRRRFALWWRQPRVAAEILQWVQDLRRGQYDTVIDLQGLMRSAMISRLTGAPHRVGMANAREFGYLAYNRGFPIDRSLHAVDQVQALLQAAGYTPKCDMQLYSGPDDQQWLDKFLADHIGLGNSYVIIAPTARWRCKCWPIRRYLHVARRLIDQYEAKIVVLASAAEQRYISPLTKELVHQAICPQTTVGQMMALISRSRLVVCNDSAPLHVAVGFDRSIVTIFGPTNPQLVGPYRRFDSVVCPAGVGGSVRYRRHRNDQSVICQVSVAMVWEKIENELQMSCAR